MLRSKEFGKVDPVGARQAYAVGCQKGSARSCVEHYESNRHGYGGAIDLDAAATSAQRACDLGSATGCAVVGEMMLNASGLPYDPITGRLMVDRSRTGVERACMEGDALGCWLVGYFGHARLFPAEAEERGFQASVKLLGARCSSDDGWSCFLLALQYQLGLGVEASFAKAAQLGARACELGDAASCQHVAGMFLNGTGTAKDPAAALRYANSSCQASSAWGCNAACWWQMKGDGVPKDEAAGRPACEKARALFSRECDQDNGSSCWALAWLHRAGFLPDAPADRAPALFARGAEGTKSRCDRRDQGACRLLSWMYWGGDGVSVDRELSLDYERRSCEAGSGEVCELIARRFDNGDFAEKSPQRAQALFHKACALGLRGACEQLTPRADVAEQADLPLERCEGGQRASWHAPHHCCHEAQAWSDKEGRCTGVPRCPGGLVVRGESCATPAQLRAEAYAAKLAQAEKLLTSAGSPEQQKIKGREAEPFALEAVRLNPSGVRGYELLAWALQAQELNDQALRVYEEAAQAVPPAAAPKMRTAMEQLRAHIRFMEETERAIQAARNSPGYTRNPEYCGVAKLYDPWCAQNGYAMPNLLPGEDPSDPRRRGPSTGDVVANAIRDAREQQRGAFAVAPTPTQAANTAGGVSATPVGNCQPCETVDCASQLQACKAAMSQRACYEAAACVCECHRRNGGCGTSAAFLDRCVVDNRARAAQLTGTGTAVNPAVPAARSAPPSAPKRDCGAGYRSCMTGCGGCSGGVCAAPAEDPCVLKPGGCACACQRQRAACEGR